MEDRFARLFAAHPEALLIRAAEGTVADANAAAGDLFRCDVAELVGRGIEHLAPGFDVADFEARLAELEAGETLTVSAVGARADGGTFPLQLVASIDEATAGDCFLLCRDLSEQRRLEAGLYELAELARLDADTPSSAAVAGRATQVCRRLLDADRAAICAIHGADQTVEWLASHGLEALIAASADLRPDQLPWLARAMASGRPEIIDRRAASHERTGLSDAADALGIAAFAIVPMQVDARTTGALGLVWSAEPPEAATSVELLATIGRLVGLALANVRLHGEQVGRQRAIDESEARYRTLFEEGPDAMLIATWDGQILDANRAATKLYGQGREEIIGRAGDQLWRMTRQQRSALLAELRTERRASTTAVGVRADGSRFRQLMTVTVTAFRGEERLLVHARDGGPAPD